MSALDFAPDMLRLQGQAPSPLPRLVLRLLLALLAIMLLWAWLGQLDWQRGCWCRSRMCCSA